MTDYIHPLPSPKSRHHSEYSTSGDSSTHFDQWLWPVESLSDTPSGRLGMSWDEESHVRSQAINWIIRISISLQLPQLVIATASAYLHRFYMRKPIQKYSFKAMSATALFLATKVEEVPRKLEYVVREYLKFDDLGQERGSINEDSNEFQLLKQQILYFEDILLRLLCFDLSVDHPYIPLVKAVNLIPTSLSSSFASNPSLSVQLSDPAKAKSIAQAAWGFVNDSLMTPLCVLVRPEVIAASAFLLALCHRICECPSENPVKQDEDDDKSVEKFYLDRYSDLYNFRNQGFQSEPTHQSWIKAFNLSNLELVFRVANAMLDQYRSSTSPFIRNQASKIPRFPAPSLFSNPVENFEPEPTSLAFPSSINPYVHSAEPSYSTITQQKYINQQSSIDHAGPSGHSRNTSENTMQQLSYELPAASSSSKAIKSEKVVDDNGQFNHSFDSDHFVKRSRSPDSLANDLMPYPKHFKNEDSTASNGTHDKSGPIESLLTRHGTSQSTLTSLDSQSLEQNGSCIIKHNDEGSTGESSLSDMEDGELD
ncbi:hypothetical protein O181_076787 [Austropuccinia psidii MF-1]|uniref:Cyclin-like domain-containing protein n=1 Tax=Austropuccinia psidii MF-1 TaxID=1389203 RepID=A0A9Q3IE45_9BASI|nr:hypothetical protein [Austropuccinia psidii MF-1]